MAVPWFTNLFSCQACFAADFVSVMDSCVEVALSLSVSLLVALRWPLEGESNNPWRDQASLARWNSDEHGCPWSNPE